MNSSHPIFQNLHDAQRLSQDTVDTASSLSDILVQHAGPFAANTVIGSKWRQHNDIDEFTKDGIKIMSHFIVSEAPITRLISRLARFVGFAVDKRCHDGTTTSMLLFCRLALLAAQKGIGATDEPARLRFVRECSDTLNLYLQGIDELKITDADILERAKHYGIDTTSSEVRGAIAYHMAMISSKGDKDLSEKISTLVRNTPKDIYAMFRNEPTVVETPERYLLEKQDYDLSVHANLGNPDYFNHKSDTQFYTENAVIFATGKEIVKGTMECEFLLSLISPSPRWRGELAGYGVDKGWEELSEGKRNLVILSDGMSDADLIMAIMAYNQKYPKNKIVHIDTQVPQRMRTSFDKTLHYVAGKRQFQDVVRTDPLSSFIGLEDGMNVKVELIGHTVKFSGLYAKDGEDFHPLYRDPEAFEDYTLFRRETEELIQFAENNISHHALDHGEITYLSMLYRALTCQNIWDIRIGGTAHEQYANRTVYEDAIGAALSAVSDGVMLCGYAHLAKYSLGAGEHGEAFSDTLLSIFASSVRLELEELKAHREVRKLSGKWDYLAADPAKYLRGEDHLYAASLDEEGLRSFLAKDNVRPVLIQAWTGYHEQLGRFKDIIPKLANSVHLADMRVEDVNAVQ